MYRRLRKRAATCILYDTGRLSRASRSGKCEGGELPVAQASLSARFLPACAESILLRCGSHCVDGSAGVLFTAQSFPARFVPVLPDVGHDLLHLPVIELLSAKSSDSISL